MSERRGGRARRLRIGADRLQRIEELLAGETGGRIAPRADRSAAPLSFAQERLWLTQQLSGTIPLSEMPLLLWIEGQLDVAALAAALAEIVARHEALRACFPERDGQPVQELAPPAPVRLPAEEVRHEEEVRRRTVGAAMAPFDLASGPLHRFRLFRTGRERHALAAIFHHIASDGWSSGVFARELSALYGAFAAGRPSPLAPLPIQYADYAAWQRASLSGERLERELDFWRGRLAGAPALLELPTDRPRPEVLRPEGQVLWHPFAPDLLPRLAELGRRRGASSFMVALTGFAELMRRTAGRDDLVIGTPVANRNHAEVEGLIGFFVNWLPLRIDAGGDPSFAALLERVKNAVLDAFDHQELPFEKLVAELAPARSRSHTPLAQVSFSFHGDLRRHVELAGLTTRAEYVPLPVAKFDLSVALVSEPERSGAYLEYSSQLFDADTVARMARHLERLLERLAAAPERPASLAPMVDADEIEARGPAVEPVGERGATVGADLCLHALFAEQADRRPDAVALCSGAAQMTYGELDRRSDAVARRLVALGVTAETLVGLCVERTPDIAIGILGILKAGGAYVPLDPRYPAERLAFLIEDTRAPVVVTRRGVGDRVPGARLFLDDVGEERFAAVQSSPDSAAYVIHTSGSTGRPKGVVVPHRHVVRLLSSTQSWFGFDDRDVWTLFHSFAFDFSVWELWGALASGGRLVLVPHEVSRSPDAFAALVADQRVTVLNQTPSAFRQFMLAEERLGRELALRVVVFGGEALELRGLAPWFARHPDRPRLVNMYGITETTVHVTYRPITASDVETSRGSLIGAPIPDLSMYLLDRQLMPVPTGAAGEIFVGGAGVARGYLGRPDLTAERFVPDPFGAPGGRLYRSGDLARARRGGELEYAGRADHQVKVRGFRVETGEIESALAQHPSVRDCAVVARRDGEDVRLVAYVVAPEVPRDLRAFVAARLPDHMVPAAFVALDRLPLTAHGKVDRGALPEPPGARPDLGAPLAPATPLEETLAVLFCQVIGVDQVGAGDSFFELGGHSLLAVRLVARIRDALGADLPLGAVFEAPTVAGLAARIGAVATAPPLIAAHRSEAPLSFAQQRLWFLDRIDPGSPLYNVALALRVRGRLDTSALERALGEIVRRHEVLRTRLVGDDEPVQVIVPAEQIGFRIAIEDLEGDDDVERRVAAEVTAGFDLAQAPLLRARLLRLDPADHLLVLVVHHVACDGWSLGVLQAELSALYRAFAAGEASPLPELPVQVADHAVWQRDRLRGAELDRHLAHWKRALAGARPIELPADRPRPARPSTRGGRVTATLSPEVTGALGELGRREGATPFMTFLAAFAALLHRTSGHDDLLIGTPVAGRDRPEIERLIGFFVNTLVLRADLSGDPSFRELVGRVRDAALSAFAHQELPFERLVEELAPRRDLAHQPVFQVAFALQNAPAAAMELPGVSLAPVPVETHTAKFDLTLNLVPAGGGLRAVFEYSRDLFDHERIERMAGHLRTLLDGIAADPDCAVSRLPLLGEEERARLASAAEVELAGPGCLHQLVEAQVDRTPDAPALRYEGETLTYRELDRRANRLAHHLAGRARDQTIALCVDRSFDLPVAVLAILKAGAAFFPLDPSHPRERLRGMIEDAGARCVVAGSAARGQLPAGVHVVWLDDPEIASRPDERPPVTADPECLAYVLFTSGSTGRPKGVMVPHRAVRNTILAQQAEFPLGPASRLLHKTPITFDASVWELFLPLMTGACIVVARPGGHQDPGYMLDLASREQVTDLQLSPSVFEELIDAPELSATSLRRVYCGGEALSDSAAARFFARSGAELVNLYGPTEAAIQVTAWRCRRDERGPVPIGRPWPNVRAAVRDRWFGLVPVGVWGELTVGGVQLARGYAGRPDLTAERFLPDPDGPPGSRLYRTGDVARWRGDGALEFGGRIDHQVKVRGFRVETGEVEAVLERHPSVRSAAVVARERAGDARLVAYYVASAPLSAEELRRHAAGLLPDPMLPSVFVALDSMPLGRSGKLDRAALPEPDEESRGEYVAPRTPLEERLAALFSAVLGVDPISIDADFFALGGHSLLAVKLVARIRDQLGVALPLPALFRAPTVAGLAAELADAPPAPRMPPLVATGRARGRASPIQRLSWEAWRADPHNTLAHVSTAWRLDGELDTTALHRALDLAVDRIEVLRTVFRKDGDDLEQIVAQVAPGWEEEDLSALPDGERDQRMRMLLDRGSSRPFDLERGPPCRALLLRLSAREHALLVVVQHACFDGQSIAPFCDELARAYRAALSGDVEDLGPRPLQFLDHCEHQLRLRDSAAGRAERRFWEECLAGAEPPELPVDHPREPVERQRAAIGMGAAFPVGREDLAVDPEVAARLSGLPATQYMVLLAVLGAALRRWTGQEDLVVRSTYSHRDSPEKERLVGFVGNPLFLRMRAGAGRSHRDFLAHVCDVVAAAYEHPNAPLLEWVPPGLSRINFNFVPSNVREEEAWVLAPDLTGRSIELPASLDSYRTPFDLHILPYQAGGTLFLRIYYNRLLFRAASIRALLDEYASALGRMAFHPDEPL